MNCSKGVLADTPHRLNEPYLLVPAVYLDPAKIAAKPRVDLRLKSRHATFQAIPGHDDETLGV